MSIKLASGPPTNSVTAKVAEEQLRTRAKLGPEVEVQLLPVQGQWVAAWHEAEFPPAKDEGGSEEEEVAPPKEEGGEPDGPPSDDGPSDEGEGPPKKDGPPKEKGGEAGELKQLLHAVTQIAMALGIEPGGPGPMDSPVPGGPGGPEGPPPPGPPGPPHSPHGGPGGPDQIVQHQRATKPGEAPPGVTPIGTPAFASNVPDDHPWKNHIGKVASFTCANVIPEDINLADVDMQLQQLGYTAKCKELPGGFKVKQVTEGRDDSGRRIAKALISAY